MGNKEYTGKQVFEVEYSEVCTSMKIEIDFDFINPPNSTIQLIKEMVEFWNGWEDDLEGNENDYVITFIKQLFLCLLLDVKFYENLSIDTAIELFGKHQEGYYPLDGSSGIKLLEFVKPDYIHEDFSVSFVKAE